MTDGSASTRRPATPARAAVIVVLVLLVLGLALAVWRTTAPPARPEGLTVSGSGVPAYYQRFHAAPEYGQRFPIGVWAEVIAGREDVVANRDAGINTFVGLEGTPNLEAIAAEGMAAFVSPDRTPGVAAAAGPAVQGWLLADEVDMWAGPGEAAWTGREPGRGPVCRPTAERCGYTVQQQLSDRVPRDGRLRFANYGKGVLFWLTDGQAGRFVNDYQDVVAIDAYWYTDPQLCSNAEGGRLISPSAPRSLSAHECHRAENYGLAVQRVRALLDPEAPKPVWTFVELGHPSTDPTAPSITPPQVRAAVWSALIGGARGIVYFNHSFAGPCVSHHILRDPCYARMREEVTTLNRQITELTPALNGGDVTGFLQVEPGVRTLVKASGEDVFVFATDRPDHGTTANFRLACGGSRDVEVLGEARTVRADETGFSDHFADPETVHLYRLPGAGRECGLA